MFFPMASLMLWLGNFHEQAECGFIFSRRTLCLKVECAALQRLPSNALMVSLGKRRMFLDVSLATRREDKTGLQNMTL